MPFSPLDASALRISRGSPSTGIHSPAGSFTRSSVMMPLPSRSSGPSSSAWSSRSSFQAPAFRSSATSGLRKKRVAASGLPFGQDEPGERLRGVCIGQQAVGQRERGLGGQRQHALQVGDHQHRRRLADLLPGVGADLEGQQVDAAAARRDPVDRGARRVGLVDGEQRGVGVLRACDSDRTPGPTPGRRPPSAAGGAGFWASTTTPATSKAAGSASTHLRFMRPRLREEDPGRQTKHPATGQVNRI